MSFFPPDHLELLWLLLLAAPVLTPGWRTLRTSSGNALLRLLGVRLGLLVAIGAALLLLGALLQWLGMRFRFDQPHWLALLALAVPIVWLGRISLASLDPPRRWTAIGLRLTALLLITCMLAGLQAVQTHNDLTVMAVIDHSESARKLFQPPAGNGEDNGDSPRTMEQWVRRYLERGTEAKRSADKFGMVTFDGSPNVRVMPNDTLMLESGTAVTPVQGSDPAEAIRTAKALFPEDSGRRLVLVTDGNATTGDGPRSGGAADLLAAAREARAEGVAIDVLPLNYHVDNEVMVEALHAPTQARRGESAALRIVLRATRPTAGALALKHDGALTDINGPNTPGKTMRVSKSAWTRESGPANATDDGSQRNASDADAPGQYVYVVPIHMQMLDAGANQYEAEFEPDDGSDVVAVNNAARAFTQVSGQGKVLFVNNVPGESGTILPRTLHEHGIDLDVIDPEAMPTTLTALQRYDAVMFQNVPVEAITMPQQRMLNTYVSELGGGFAMIGGESSFGAGGWADSPVEQILPVSSRIPQQSVMPSGALALVIDRSGSMSSAASGSGANKLELAGEAAILALRTLYEQDMISVIAFDASPKSIVPLQMNRDPKQIADKIRTIQAVGGTRIFPGLKMAYEQLATVDMQEAAVKHVVLLTDGESMDPAGANDYQGLVANMRAAGITMSTVGVGPRHDAQLLQRLATMGNGRYHPINDPNNLPQIFVKEARTIRKNLIKEGEFQPQRRHIGSPIMSEISSTPQLEGFVLTSRKKDPRIYMPLVGPENEPIFAHWQVGLGRTAAFTSDATNRWATAWLQEGFYEDFWARLVRTIARPARGRNLDLVTTRQGDQMRLRLDATAIDQSSGTDEDASFANFLEVTGSIVTPDGQTRRVTLEQTGPGVYEAVTPASQSGNYIANLIVKKSDGTRQTVFGGMTRPPGEELRYFRSNNAVLQRVTEITGGRMLDPQAAEPINLFDRTGVVDSRSIRPLWRTLLLILVILFLLDVAARRIAWDPIAIALAVRGRLRQIFGSLKPRRVQTEPTLGALKNRRTETVQRLSGVREQAQGAPRAQPAPSPAPATPAAPAPSRKRKFDAGAAANPQADFTSAVGGARAETDADAKAHDTSPSDQSAGEESAGTANRLRAAKQRARQNLKSSEQ